MSYVAHKISNDISWGPILNPIEFAKFRVPMREIFPFEVILCNKGNLP